MKRRILATGLLSVTAVSLLTGCVDDKYDLSNIDMTSRFTVNNLTVPINLSEIKLDKVIDLDDNDNVKLVSINGRSCYAIVKSGNINPTEFSIDGIHVASPELHQDLFGVDVRKDVNVPGVVAAIPFPELGLQNCDFDMHDVDESLLALKEVKTIAPIKVVVTLFIPQHLATGKNGFSFQNVRIQLPKNLITEADGYDPASGMWNLPDTPADSDGKAVFVLEASGLALGESGKVDDGYLPIKGKIGIESGQLGITVNEPTLPSVIDMGADYYVSAFDVKSISGSLDYHMDDIKIDPISLSGLPEFLDSPETNLIIANPQILVSLQNPVGNYGLEGIGSISMESAFKDGSERQDTSAPFTLAGSHTDLAFCTPYSEFDFVQFEGLRNVLSNGDIGLPSSINVGIKDINFKGSVTDFPLGDVGTAVGSYEFNAPLGFGAGSIVVYETSVDGWNSDTLDDVSVNYINVNAVCSTDLPVNVRLSIFPLDKDGNEIAVKEESGFFEISAGGLDQPVSLSIESANGPIRNLDGLKFRAVVMQNDPDNTDAIGPDMHIILDQVRISVDGYYEKEL